jgi:hypothetical protein
MNNNIPAIHSIKGTDKETLRKMVFHNGFRTQN